MQGRMVSFSADQRTQKNIAVIKKYATGRGVSVGAIFREAINIFSEKIKTDTGDGHVNK